MNLHFQYSTILPKSSFDNNTAYLNNNSNNTSINQYPSQYIDFTNNNQHLINEIESKILLNEQENKTQLTTLQEKLNQLIQNEFTLKEQLSLKETQLNEINKTLNNYIDENTSLRNELQTKSTHLAMYIQSYASLEETYKSVQDELKRNDMNTYEENQKEMLTNKVKQLEQQVKELQNSNNNFQIKIKELNNANIILEHENKELKNYKENIQIEIDDMKEMICNYKYEKENYEKAKNEGTQKEIKLNEEINTLNEKIKNLETYNNDTDNIKQQLQKIHETLFNEVTTNKYFDINTNNEDIFDQSIYMINQLFTLIKNMKGIQNKDDVNKLLEDNIFLYEQVKRIKIRLDEIFQDNIALNQRIKYLENEIQDKDTLLLKFTTVEDYNKKLLGDNLLLIAKLKEYYNNNKHQK